MSPGAATDTPFPAPSPRSRRPEASGPPALSELESRSAHGRS